MTPQKPRRRHAAPGPTRWTDPTRPTLRSRLKAAVGRLLRIRRPAADADECGAQVSPERIGLVICGRAPGHPGNHRGTTPWAGQYHEWPDSAAVTAMADQIGLAAARRRAALQQGLRASQGADRVVVRGDRVLAADIDRQLAAWDTDAAIRKVCRGC